MRKRLTRPREVLRAMCLVADVAFSFTSLTEFPSHTQGQPHGVGPAFQVFLLFAVELG